MVLHARQRLLRLRKHHGRPRGRRLRVRARSDGPRSVLGSKAAEDSLEAPGAFRDHGHQQHVGILPEPSLRYFRP